MRDLFLQCTYVCTYVHVCHAQGQFALTCTQRSSCVTCTDTRGYQIPSDGGQGRTVLLDNGGRVGQHG